MQVLMSGASQIQTSCIDEEMLVNLLMIFIFWQCLNSHGDIIKINWNRWYGECDKIVVILWSYVELSIMNINVLPVKMIMTAVLWWVELHS